MKKFLKRQFFLFLFLTAFMNVSIAQNGIYIMAFESDGKGGLCISNDSSSIKAMGGIEMYDCFVVLNSMILDSVLMASIPFLQQLPPFQHPLKNKQKRIAPSGYAVFVYRNGVVTEYELVKRDVIKYIRFLSSILYDIQPRLPYEDFIVIYEYTVYL